MNYQQAIAYLEAHIGRGVEPGLDRIIGLLEMMGRPDQSYPIIHVAGTNGKTSTTRMAALLLVAHGLTTGAFTSPHLERIEERLAINGQVVSPDDFARAVSDVAAFADIYEERTGAGLTYFELTAAMALAWFADQAVDSAVVEVGLGGRLDATNAIDGAVAVLTGVGIDHTEYLGTTLESIATEKLAIVKEGSVLVTGPLPRDIERLARRRAAEMGANVHVYGTDFRVEGATRALGGWQVDIEGVNGTYEDIHIPVHGRFQTINLAVAIAAVEALMGDRELSHEAVIDGAAAFTAPGRVEQVASAPLVLLDGAHNPSGFEVLARTLIEEFPSVHWVLVVASMQDKDVEAMVGSVAPRLKSVVATQTGSSRAIPAGELADRIAAVVDVTVEAVEDSARAVDVAREIADSDGAVLVAGSLYLVGAARAHLTGGDRPQRNER